MEENICRPCQRKGIVPKTYRALTKLGKQTHKKKWAEKMIRHSPRRSLVWFLLVSSSAVLRAHSWQAQGTIQSAKD